MKRNKTMPRIFNNKSHEWERTEKRKKCIEVAYLATLVKYSVLEVESIWTMYRIQKQRLEKTELLKFDLFHTYIITICIIVKMIEFLLINIKKTIAFVPRNRVSV